jgi:two-component system, NarL family, nitrate/nitrite response regulator NarL
MSKQAVVTVLVGMGELLREGITRILGTSKFRVGLSAANLQELLSKPLSRYRSILLIIDIDNRDSITGFDQISMFKAAQQGSRVVILTDDCSSSRVASALRAGADAFLTKGAAYDTFIKSLELVTRGHTVLPSEALGLILGIIEDPKPNLQDFSNNPQPEDDDDEQELAVLSPRERCILQHLVDGHSNKMIARKVNITEATVKVHVKTILRKIRVNNRTQAAVWAMSNGMFMQSGTAIASTTARDYS